jgi:hypothetical protein
VWTTVSSKRKLTNLVFSSQLIFGLEEALTGLKGREQGMLIHETRGENTGNSWRLFPIECTL